MSDWKYGDDELLTPGEVAKEFKVDPKTVTRWAKGGRIPDVDGKTSVVRTFGGHIRVRALVVRKVLAGEIKLEYGTDREVTSS